MVGVICQNCIGRHKGKKPELTAPLLLEPISGLFSVTGISAAWATAPSSSAENRTVSWGVGTSED